MRLYATTIGTLLVGIFFNTFLYGVVTYQFAVYCQTKFNDRLLIKCMVLFLFILDTFHSASMIYMAWYYTVGNYDNPAALAVNPWPYAFTPTCVALAALVTHIYLATRILRLTRSNFLYGMVILLATLSFILGIAATVMAWLITLLSELPRITPLVITWLSVQVIVDTLITAILVIVFTRSRTGFRKTDTILNRLIRGAIQTGLFASIFSLGDLIMFVLLPDTNLFGMFAVSIGRIYTNTLMDTLLTRKLLMRETDDAGNITQSIVIDSVYWAPSGSQSVSMGQSRTPQDKEDRSAPKLTSDKIIPPHV